MATEKEAFDDVYLQKNEDLPWHVSLPEYKLHSWFMYSNHWVYTIFLPCLLKQTISLVGFFRCKKFYLAAVKFSLPENPQVVAALRGFPRESRDATEGLGCSGKKNLKLNRCFRKWWYGGTPKSSILIGFSMVFHYKPSILGYPYFWKPPYI